MPGTLQERWVLFRIFLVYLQDELKPEDLVGARLLKKKKPKDVSPPYHVTNLSYMY